MTSRAKTSFWVSTKALAASSCLSILLLIVLASADAAAADPCAPLGFQTGNGNRCVFPVEDVAGLIAAITAANRANSILLSSDIVLKPGTYILTGVASNADGPNGLPSITGVITI